MKPSFQIAEIGVGDNIILLVETDVQWGGEVRVNTKS